MTKGARHDSMRCDVVERRDCASATRQRRAATPCMPPRFCYLLLLSGAHSWTIGASVMPKRNRGGVITLKSPQEESVAPLDTAARLTLEDVATIPKPGSMGLGLVRFSPDDRYVTYLGSAEAASLTRQLFAYDRETGETKQVIGSADSEESFSAEEKLRRERARIMSVGVTEYSWAKKANRLLVPKDGALYVQDGVGEGAGATLRRLFDPADAKWAEVGSGAPLDAKLSDDGAQVFFVWDREVCACDVAASNEDDACRGAPQSGARGDAGITNGIADYCAQEEMDRYTGYWPSPSGSTRAGALVAFEEVDEQHIPLFTIMNQGVDGPHAQNEAHRYPFAGAANPKVRLGVVSNVGSSSSPAAPTWFDLSGPFGDDFYLARVHWIANPLDRERLQHTCLLRRCRAAIRNRSRC